MANDFMNPARYAAPSILPENLFNLDPITPQSMGFGGDFLNTGQLNIPTFATQYGTGTPGGGGGFMGGLKNLVGTVGGTSEFSKAGGGPNVWQNLFGGKDLDTKSYTPGIAGGLASFGSDLFGGFMKYKGMKQAQDALDFQKESWMKNYEANKQSYNQRAADLNFARRARHRGKDTFSKVEELK
jgi:hypothetical protein